MTTRIKKIVVTTLVCMLGGAVMFGLFGCRDKDKKKSADTPQYKVSYDNKSFYENAKDSFAAGEEVELYYRYIATDTDYHFYLDDEPLNYQYDDDKGFVLSFTMPDHDVTLRHESKNSMIAEQPSEPVDMMLIDFYRGTAADDENDGYDEITVFGYDDTNVSLNVYSQHDGMDEVETDYLVPREAVDRCGELVKEYKLSEWDDLKEYESLEGARLICKFRDDSGYIRVTSDKMPENGEEAFNAIEAVLKEYVKDEYKVQY